LSAIFFIMEEIFFCYLSRAITDSQSALHALLIMRHGKGEEEKVRKSAERIQKRILEG
jgi:hypothetical protein